MVPWPIMPWPMPCPVIIWPDGGGFVGWVDAAPESANGNNRAGQSLLVFIGSLRGSRMHPPDEHVTRCFSEATPMSAMGDGRRSSASARGRFLLALARRRRGRSVAWSESRSGRKTPMPNSGYYREHVGKCGRLASFPRETSYGEMAERRLRRIRGRHGPPFVPFELQDAGMCRCWRMPVIYGTRIFS